MIKRSLTVKMSYGANFSIDISEPTLKAITQAYIQVSRMLLSDFFQTVVKRFTDYFMELKTKPFYCGRCGNREEFIWKTREGKLTEVLTLFGIVPHCVKEVFCLQMSHT